MTRPSMLFCVFLLSTSVALAQNPRLRTPENPAVDSVLSSLSALHEFAQTAISPDGKRVAWIEWLHRGAEMNTAIYVAEVRTPAKPRQITATSGDIPASEREVVWSPDSRKIAFLSDAAKTGQQQLYIADVASGAARKFTDLTGFLSSPAWSPDGKSIAILFIENSPRAAGPLQPMTPDAGVVDEHILEQRIVVVDARTGNAQTISPADLYVYEYAWAPDGKSFVASAAHGSGDNNWWLAQLYLIPVQGEARSIYKPKLQIANPRFSPDGKQIAFIEGLMSDQGATGGDIFLVPATGGEARNLTPKLPASPSWLTWAAPDRILFTEQVDGNAGIATVDTSGNVSTLWTMAEAITSGDWNFSLSIARDVRTTSVIRSSAQHGQEVWSGTVGAWTQVTHANTNLRPLWGEARSIHWTSDQYRVQGWLLLPRNYDPARHYPLVVHVHGGPASACTAGWPDVSNSPLAAVGYFVLCPNPRGSFGQGEAFTEANVKDLGGGDFRDIMSGVDEVLKQFSIDKNRIGIKGWSYGGYMTMWAETQTNRFHAAIAGAGLANFQSYYGQNDIDQWMIPYFGASVYDDPAVYAKSSPITYVKNVKTPTLILVGDRDGEVPAPQSYEWWHALKTLGVPVQFVVYPNEGHQIFQPEHRRDIILRTVNWFDKYLPEQKTAATAAK